MAWKRRSCGVPLLPWHRHSSTSDGDSSKPRHHDDGDMPKEHRPISLRAAFSVVCLVYTLALIAALEYCFGTFPTAENRRTIPDGRGYEIYGPFNYAPLGRWAAAETDTGTATPTSTGTANVDTAISFTSSSQQSWDTSTITEAPWSPLVPSSTPPPTPSSITESVIPGETPETWDDAYNQAVMFGAIAGIPGYGLNITREEPYLNLTTPPTNATLTRRVPPRDKWGQLSGRVQYVIFDVLGWKYRNEDPWTIASYIWYSYLAHPNVENPKPSDTAYLKAVKSKSYCSIVCDGPALVFLETYCWEGWKDKASLYSRRLSETPGARTAQSEDVWGDATVCTSVATRDGNGVGGGGGGGGPTPVVSSQWMGGGGASIRSTTRTITGLRTTRVTVVPLPTTLPVIGTAQPSVGVGGGGDSGNVGGPGGGDNNGGNGGGGGGQGQPNRPTTSVTELWITTTLVRNDDKDRPLTTITAVLQATRTVITMTDPRGKPMVVTTDLLLVPGVQTVDRTPTTGLVPLAQWSQAILTDSRGLPIATVRQLFGSAGPTLVVPPDSPNGDRTNGFIGPGCEVTDSSGQCNSKLTPGDGYGYVQAVHPLSWGDYLVASFAPILMALPLAILIQIQASTIKQLLPFHILSRGKSPSGVSAGKSLCLTTGGIQGIINGIRLLVKDRDPLLFLTDLHVLATSLVVSFSSEALGIKLYGQCTPDDFTGCRMGIAVFRAPGRVVEAFLAVALVINLVITGILLRNSAWKTTLDIYSRQGGSISATASLLVKSSPETQSYFRKLASGLPHGIVRVKEMKARFAGSLFAIRSSAVPAHIQRAREPQLSPEKGATHHYYLTITPSTPGHDTLGEEEKKNTSNIITSERRWQERLAAVFISRHQGTINQVAFILAVVGFLIMLFYYELTSTTSAFERFMNSQSLGVRAVFTGLGIIVSLFWDNYFSNVATQEPYRQLSTSTTPSSPRKCPFSSFPISTIDGDDSLANTMTKPPPPPATLKRIPSTAFSVLFNPSFLLKRETITRHVFLTLVAFTTALSKITPLLLSNVPFSPWLTWTTHEACTWSAIAILFLMIFVLIGGMILHGWCHRRRRRMVNRSGTDLWVEVDLATLGGKLVFGSLYYTPADEANGKRPGTGSGSSGYDTAGSR